MPRKLPDLVMLAIFILVISIPLATPLPSAPSFQDQFGTPQSAFSAGRFAKAAVDFPPAFTSYFEDHHLLHQQLVNTLLNFRLKILRESVFPNVLIGKENWLYYTGENNIADFECTFPFTPNELKAIRARLLGLERPVNKTRDQVLHCFRAK